MGIPDRLIEFLKASKMRFELIRHSEAFTAQELAELEHVKGRFHAKVVLARCRAGHLMLVLPSDHRVDLEKLEELFPEPVAIDSEEDLRALFPDCSLGKMPPFGKLYGLSTVIDEALADKEVIVFEAGTHTDAIKMRMSDYLCLAEGKVADFTVKLHPMTAL